jgi:hypothetical protein
LISALGTALVSGLGTASGTASGTALGPNRATGRSGAPARGVEGTVHGGVSFVIIRYRPRTEVSITHDVALRPTRSLRH